jgi:outer membrane protein assembly factor BamD
LRRIISGLSLLSLAGLVAISGTACMRPKEEPKIAYQERPVEVLYGLAASMMDAGAFDTAVLYFREVERQHPYSDWARRAMVMAVYCNYRTRNYPEAIAGADSFASLYPGNPMSGYAYYIKAVSYYEQIVDVGRDQGNTELAQAALREVIRRYPGTDYAADARLKLQRVDDHLAGKEMTVGRFYLNNGDTLAAVSRFRTVIERYQTTSHAPEALYRLVEAYLTLGVIDEAQRNAAVLGANYPGDRWYADAYELMNDRGLRPAVDPTSTRRLRNLFGLTSGPTAPVPVQPAGAGALPPPAPTTSPAPPAGPVSEPGSSR